ncbi:hypothetical protein K474DRAFT_1587999 [Panus rudis PR-1116 ss-1]|nr:hypothetical protein K474DRAFT_1587999 [Panus rudis PR-1116 ss-1]
MPSTNRQLILAKAALVLSNAVCTQISFSPPRPPVSPEDEKTYKADHKSRDWLPGMGRGLPWAFKVVVLLFNAAEILTLLSIAFPSEFRWMRLVSTAGRSPYISSHFIFGTIIVHLATYLRITCYRLLGEHFTYELSIQKNHKLITHGPYAYVRHPSYAAIILFMLGIWMAQMKPGSWYVECGIGNTSIGGRVSGYVWMFLTLGGVALSSNRCAKEDRVLRRQFQDEWLRWHEQTPYRLVPYIY